MKGNEQKAKYKNLDADRRNQVGDIGENDKAKAKACTGESAVRKNQQVGKEETESQVVRTGKEADERKLKKGKGR